MGTNIRQTLLVLTLMILTAAVVGAQEAPKVDEALRAEALRAVLQHKSGFFEYLTNALMIWWVSSVAFCGSILSSTWLKRKEISNIRFMDWLFTVVFVFFLSIVVFGLYVVYAVGHLRVEVSALLDQLHVSSDQLYEFRMVQVGVGIGSSSFIFVLFTWIGMWIVLRKMRTRSRRRSLARR